LVLAQQSEGNSHERRVQARHDVIAGSRTGNQVTHEDVEHLAFAVLLVRFEIFHEHLRAGNDHLGAATLHGEAKLSSTKLALEPVEGTAVRSAEGVDGLTVITHDADASAANALTELELGRGHVLRFVNDDQVVDLLHPAVTNRQEDHIGEINLIAGLNLGRQFHRLQRVLADELRVPLRAEELLVGLALEVDRDVHQVFLDTSVRYDLAALRVQLRNEAHDGLRRIPRARLHRELVGARDLVAVTRVLDHDPPELLADAGQTYGVERARTCARVSNARLQFIRDPLVERGEQDVPFRRTIDSLDDGRRLAGASAGTDDEVRIVPFSSFKPLEN